MRKPKLLNEIEFLVRLVREAPYVKVAPTGQPERVTRDELTIRNWYKAGEKLMVHGIRLKNAEDDAI